MDFKPTTPKNTISHEPQLEEDPFVVVGSTTGGGGGASSFADPLCQLNLKETSDFVRSLPLAPRCSLESSRNSMDTSSAAQLRRGRAPEVPTTPGRPLLGLYGGNLSRKGVPSKWEDAEKWLVSTSCRESPAHSAKQQDFDPPRTTTTATTTTNKLQGEVFCQKGDAFVEKEKRVRSSEGGRLSTTSLHRPSLDVPLKDKFTDNVELVFPSFQCSEPTKESFLFKNSSCGVEDVKRRDVGTEMTPLGSLTTSRCHTPIKTSSPARHNTPADRSGLLVPPNPSIDVLELKDSHFAKLELEVGQLDSMVSNWSSREEEEEEISKSLRHFEIGGGDGKRSTMESRALAWEDDERAKSCMRYQREEAKIQAWVNLQSAKAEAQSRKLEVKIQKMRANLEEKLMKRLASVHKRAEEWRAAAQLLHSQEIQKASEQAQKMKSEHGFCLREHSKCGCFRLNNHI